MSSGSDGHRVIKSDRLLDAIFSDERGEFVDVVYSGGEDSQTVFPPFLHQRILDFAVDFAISAFFFREK